MPEVARIEEAYHWNLTRIADAFGMNRGTVRKRIQAAGVRPSSVRKGVQHYALADVGPALFSEQLVVGGEDPNDLPPQERRAWYQSENERLKFEKETSQLVPLQDMQRDVSIMAKSIITMLDTLPDQLERDLGLTADTVQSIQDSCDAAREQLYTRILDDLEEDEQ